MSEVRFRMYAIEDYTGEIFNLEQSRIEAAIDISSVDEKHILGSVIYRIQGSEYKYVSRFRTSLLESENVLTVYVESELNELSDALNSRIEEMLGSNRLGCIEECRIKTQVSFEKHLKTPSVPADLIVPIIDRGVLRNIRLQHYINIGGIPIFCIKNEVNVLTLQYEYRGVEYGIVAVGSLLNDGVDAESLRVLILEEIHKMFIRSTKNKRISPRMDTLIADDFAAGYLSVDSVVKALDRMIYLIKSFNVENDTSCWLDEKTIEDRKKRLMNPSYIVDKHFNDEYADEVLRSVRFVKVK